MTTDPPQDPWSSRAGNAFGRDNPLIDPSASNLARRANRKHRCIAYCAFALALETVSHDEVEAARIQLQHPHPRGPDRFRLAIESQLIRRAGPGKISRPRKPAALEESALCPR